MKENENNDAAAKSAKLPPWLKRRIPAGGDSSQITKWLNELGLATVCTAAHCPNQGECRSRGTATFMIMGEQCTRQCRFCAVTKGQPLPLRTDEPEAVAEACVRMGLKYVVVTSVTRDDLADGGASHFARTIKAIRHRIPEALVEVLTPDFGGSKSAIDTVLAAGPDVFDHNVETVARLYPSVRPPGSVRGLAPDYARSLDVLAYVKSCASTAPRKLLTKSGLMLGVGETEDEIRSALTDLRNVGVDILTLGQYLAPSTQHWPVSRFVEPEEFTRWDSVAKEMGFPVVLSGPFVRSSYHADLAFIKL